MKKLFLLSIISIAVIIGMIFVISTALPNESDYSDNLFYQIGRVQREALESNESNVAAVTARDFTICERDVMAIAQEYYLVNGVDGREFAIQTLLRREILYSAALNNGFYATNEEIRYLIDLNIEMTQAALAPGASSNIEEYFLPFLRGIGMTPEEYWEAQADIFRKEIAISNFQNSLLESFSFDEARAIAFSSYEEGLHNVWNEQWERIVEELIQSTEFTITPN